MESGGGADGEQVVAFACRERHRLLDDNVLAGGKGACRPVGMTVGWSGDDDDIDVGIVEEGACVVVVARARPCRRRRFPARGVAVGDTDQPQSGGGGDRRCVLAPMAP